MRVQANGAEADGASVFELAMLAVVQGATIRISAERSGAEDAIRSLVYLVSGEPSGT